MKWDEYGREKCCLLKVMCVDDQKTNVLSWKSSCKNSDFNKPQQIRSEAKCCSCTCVYHEGIRMNGHTAPLFNLGTTWR